MNEDPAPTPERPSRYSRSFGGLVIAMAVTVLFVAAYVGFRALTRDQPDIEPEVGYASCVALLQEAGVAVVHPESLPGGWRSTAVHFERGTPPEWRIAMLTADDEFVGVVQQQEDVDDLLEDYVDESPEQGEDATPANGLGVATWETWSDTGGDHAFSAELTAEPMAGQTVLVYGSAPVTDQETLLRALTLDPATGAANDCDTDSLS